MQNFFVAKACDADLCAASMVAQGWRERISLAVAIEDYETRNEKNPLSANERAKRNK